MFAIVLKVIAFLLFLAGAFNQTLLGQGELDLYGFALAAWVLASLLGGVNLGAFVVQRRSPSE